VSTKKVESKLQKNYRCVFRNGKKITGFKEKGHQTDGRLDRANELNVFFNMLSSEQQPSSSPASNYTDLTLYWCLPHPHHISIISPCTSITDLNTASNITDRHTQCQHTLTLTIISLPYLSLAVRWRSSTRPKVQMVSAPVSWRHVRKCFFEFCSTSSMSAWVREKFQSWGWLVEDLFQYLNNLIHLPSMTTNQLPLHTTSWMFWKDCYWLT